MAKDLRQFLETVKALGPDYFVRAAKPLSTEYEVTVLQQQLARAKRFPVVYCPDIVDRELPLVSGLFGSYEMLGLALDLSPTEIRQDPGVILREYRKRSMNPLPTVPVDAAAAPVKEVIRRSAEVDLGRLPIIRQAAGNPAPYVTVGMLVCRDPDSGLPNVGVYRQQVLGPNRVSCMIYPNHDGGRIARRYAELGQPMEVVTFIGHHPVLGMTAVGHRGAGAQEDEMAFAGGLLGEGIEVTPGTTVDLPVPARAEIAIEGILDPGEVIKDGPFSEADGYYGIRKPSYIIRVSAITMRRDAIYQELDPVHAEHNLIGLLGRESRLQDALAQAVPGTSALHLGPEGQTAKFLVYIALDKPNADDVRRAGLAALNFPFNNKVVVVDTDIDVYDESEVLWALATRATHAEDFQVVTEGGPAKLIIDATVPRDRPFPTRVTYPPEVWNRIRPEDYLTEG
jgi:2,5-furandicarboxylate decarboxylase 1